MEVEGQMKVEILHCWILLLQVSGIRQSGVFKVTIRKIYCQANVVHQNKV